MSLPTFLPEAYRHDQAGSGTSHLVKQVYDQYIDFVSLERDLFSMNMDASYKAFNDNNVTEVNSTTRRYLLTITSRRTQSAIWAA